MKFNLTSKEINVLKVVSQVAGGFSLVVALTMIFSLIQLYTIKPLDSPALAAVKEQYDRDPANSAKAEQVRAMDLMARKAYFSSRWQVETGSYLLLAGAVIFIFCQWLIAENEKIKPVLPGPKTEISDRAVQIRKYLLVSASVISVTAIAASFVLRSELPDLSQKSHSGSSSGRKGNNAASKPDKTNYPFFRGQDSRGIAGGSGYPTEWDGAAGKNIGWKIVLPKPGKSSPVIWNDRIFITGAEGNQCDVYCIDKNSGAILWTGSASGVPGEPAEEPKMDREAGLAVSTAATNGKVVCAIFANGNLACFDLKGTRKWAKNIGSPQSSYGYSSSLLIFDNLLLVQYDSNDKIALMGFDLETGELKWETPRRGRTVWSSPVLAYFGGTPQVVINGNPAVSSFDAVTGKELWSVECMSGDVAPSVAVNSTMAFAVTDYAKLTAIKAGTGASVAWEDNTFTPDVSSPAATDTYLFVSTGNGDVACYNSQKGDTLWSHYFTDPFYSSPVIADDKVYLLDRSGVMHIVEAGSSFKLVSEAALGETADCTPAFSDKKIYIRGSKNLYCITKN
jgi:outer membrane protein assembly factor BamB